MTPDRVAEALAALEAAEKALPLRLRTDWSPSRRERVAEVLATGGFSFLTEHQPRVDLPQSQLEALCVLGNAAPALLKLARLWTEPAPYGRQFTALAELAEAVLGPEPGQ